MRTLLVLGTILMTLGTMGGCANPSTSAAEHAVNEFYTAYHQRDGATACALLAAATRHAVAQSTGAPCATGLLDENLPQAGTAKSAHLYGDQAQVRLVGDTVFVAAFPGGWRVVAVGCTARPDMPYDCEVEAG
jgi:hypothetical protein